MCMYVGVHSFFIRSINIITRSKATFSKSRIFERITDRSVLTYLDYGGIFDSGSFRENKIFKL